MSLLEKVLEELSTASSDFKIFLNYHFKVIKEQSLTPTIDIQGKSTFPVKVRLEQKLMLLSDKIKYYIKDLSEYIPKNDKENITKQIIIDDLEEWIREK